MVVKLEKLKDTEYNQVLGLLLQTLNDIIEYDPAPSYQRESLKEESNVVSITVCQQQQAVQREIGTETERSIEITQILKNKIC